MKEKPEPADASASNDRYYQLAWKMMLKELRRQMFFLANYFEKINGKENKGRRNERWKEMWKEMKEEDEGSKCGDANSRPYFLTFHYTKKTL
jgi:hypothetical protein